MIVWVFVLQKKGGGNGPFGLRSLEQAMLDSIAGEFCVVFHVHFFKYPIPIRVDRLLAQREFFGNDS